MMYSNDSNFIIMLSFMITVVVVLVINSSKRKISENMGWSVEIY